MGKRKASQSPIRGGAQRQPDCPQVPRRIHSLGRYFDVFNSVLGRKDVFWFRGQADISWRLVPSALRYPKESECTRVLGLLSDFKRFVKLKLDRVPAPDENLKWTQLAQHYGLPTRLLDWTKNAAIALYFACLSPADKDGAVYVLNPVDLNREKDPKRPRVFDPHSDDAIIRPYLELGGDRTSCNMKTIALHPIWNSERIMLQQGVFTLHGSPQFVLRARQAPSLVHVRIEARRKQRLLDELERVGVNEMAIFPEPEHVCRYLRKSAQLPA